MEFKLLAARKSVLNAFNKAIKLKARLKAGA